MDDFAAKVVVKMICRLGQGCGVELGGHGEIEDVALGEHVAAAFQLSTQYLRVAVDLDGYAVHLRFCVADGKLRVHFDEIQLAVWKRESETAKAQFYMSSTHRRHPVH